MLHRLCNIVLFNTITSCLINIRSIFRNLPFVFVGGIWEQVRVDGRAPLEKILDNVRVVGVVDCLGVLDIGFFGVEVARRMVAL